MKQDRKVRDMVAFLTSDVFVKFVGGFVLGLIGVMTLNPAEAQQRPDDLSAAKVQQEWSNDIL